MELFISWGYTKEMAWLHDEDTDILDEISQYSELETDHDNSYKSIQPKTIQEYNARISSNNRGSVFDSTLFDNDDEGITYVALGRGRGGRNTYFKPGSSTIEAKGVAQCEQEIKDKIREISGLGYSNIYIQASVKAKQAKMDQTMCDLGQALDQKLVTTTSNSCIPPTGSSSKDNSSSNRNTPRVGNNKKSVTLNSSKHSLSQTSKHDEFDTKEDNVSEAVENREHYPPLNEMLKKSRMIHLHQKNKENNCDISSSNSNNSTRSKNKNYNTNVSWINKPNGRGKNFNIESPVEFPQL